MCDIKFKLSVPNNNAKNIMIRKFFQMVFMRDDHKSLCIYTAIVFSGENQDISNIDQYLSFKGGTIKPFFIDCEVIVADDEKAFIKYMDCTNSLWEQRECIGKVWGKCEICKTQTEVQKHLQKIVGTGEKINDELSAVDNDNKPLFIEQEGKGKSHMTLVTKGVCKDMENGKCSIMPNDDKSSLSMHVGMESMVWLKTEIKLSRNFTSNNFKYEFNLDVPDNVICYTPDFTLYFTPPIRYEVIYEKAIVEFGKDKERNLVSFVANETTVNFKEWIQEEHIEEKNKCRVLTSNFISRPEDNQKNFKVMFVIENVKSTGNRQFLLGIIVSAVMAFGLDYTKLCELEQWISFNGLPPDVVWILMITPFLFAIFLKYPTGPASQMVKKIFLLLRALGIILFSLWAIWVFVISRLDWNSQVPEISKYINHGVMLLAFIFNTLYDIYCVHKRNYELLALVRG